MRDGRGRGRALAPRLSAIGVPPFDCAPDPSPELMAAIREQDIAARAPRAGVADVSAAAG